ncbi:MAG: hypothetical protein K2X38_08440 [Gemmataceae bacterium]|nr:hypothetical protein [Gemmataceae bacterium]
MASMACPQCNRVYAPGKSECPGCRVALLESIRGDSDSLPDEPSWQHTPWGRIAVGLFLAQGLTFGFNHLLKAGGLAATGWDLTPQTPEGVIALRLVQVMSLLFAAVLLGAGLVRAVMYGSLLGLVNGLIALVFPSVSEGETNEWLMMAIPALHLFVGAAGAFAGRLIWKPPPQFLPTPNKRKSHPASGFKAPDALQGPLHPFRVVIASFAVLWGALFARFLLRWIVDHSNGLFQQQSGYQERMLTYQLVGLIALFAGAFAGSNTFNGLKQGIFVGILGAGLYVGMQLTRMEMPSETIFFLASVIFAVATLGGFFGGQLFPPVAKQRGRRSVLDY